MGVIANGISDTPKIELTTNSHNQPTWTKTVLVQVDSKDDSNLVAEAAPGFVLGSPFKFRWNGPVTDSRAVCTGAKTSIAELTSDGYVYEVTYTFEQLENNQTPSNPLNSPAEFSWSYEKLELPIDFDINNDPIRNTAREKFDPPVTINANILKLSVTQNESVYNPGLSLAYSDKVNSDAFQGAAAGQVLCESITGQGPNIENDVTYWKVNYVFAFYAGGWKKKMLNAGMKELDDNGKLQNIELKGSEVSSPVALDLNGKAIKDNSGTPVKLEFEVYEQVPFSGTFNFRV
jgi:hypothetical protein